MACFTFYAFFGYFLIKIHLLHGEKGATTKNTELENENENEILWETS